MVRRFSCLILLVGLTGPLLAAAEPLPAPLPGLEPGLIVYVVEPDSPAAKAGVQVGDVLLSYDGTPLLFFSSLDEAQEKAEAAKKETVAVELRRGEETQTVTVPLGKLGVSVRPPLPPAAQALWEEGRALSAENHTEAAEKWQAAAEAAQQAGDARAAACLWMQAGEQWDTAQSFDQAAAAYAQAAEQAQVAGDACSAADALNSQGIAASKRGNLSEARKSFQQALAICKKLAPDSLKVAASLNNLGILACQQGNLAEGKEFFQQALSIWERLAPDGLYVATSLSNLGNIAVYQGLLEEAKGFYRRSLAIREHLGPDSLDVASSLDNLGLLARQQGNLAEATEYHQRSLSIKEQLAPDSLDMAIGLNNLGLVIADQGDLAAAKEYYQRALEIRERLAPNSLEVSDCLGNLGNVACNQGDLVGAKAYYHRALAIRDRLAPDSLEVTDCLNNLGNVVADQGNLVEAKVYYQRALAIQEQLAPDSPQVADYLNNLGILAHDQGNLVEARDYYQRARAVLEERVPVSLNLASNLTNLGALAHDQGKLGEAKDYYQRARAVLEQISPDSLGVATSLNNLGVVAYEQGGLEEAIRCYRQGLRLAQDRGGREETVANSGGLGRTLAAQGDLPGADEAYLLCLDTLEGWREVAGREAEEQAGLFSRFSSPFPEYAALLLKRDHPGEAFQVSERGKGRALLDVLAVGRTPLLERDLTAEERQEYAQREQKYYQLNQQVLQKQQENDDARLKELRPQRDEARFQLANYEQRLYTLHPGLQAQVGEVKPLTADAARRLPLPPDTLVLSYLVGEKQTLLFALRRTNPKKPGELAVHVLDLEAEALDDEVNSLRASLLPQTATGDASQVGFYTRRARKVGETLLKPVQKWLKKAKHLIVCSDQFLYDIPFGALIAPGQKEPLLTTHAVSLAPSVTVLGEWLKAPPKSAEPPRLLALGNPALPKPAAVQVASTRQMTDPGGGWRGEFERTREGRLVDLQFAKEEVEELAKLYGERATPYIGPEAQEARVKAEAGQYRILHFATHALLDNAAPMYSKLLLAQEGEMGGEDGLLEAREILQQRWDADLVVLSACQTARGRKAGGEGILGMSWACLAAGARQVVATQWPVADDSTKALMVKFHQELLAGTPAAEALRRAQGYVRAQPPWAAPYHWAGFVLVGPGG